MSMPPSGLRAGRPVRTLFAVVATVTMTLGVAPPGAFAAAASPAAGAACVPTVNAEWSAARIWDEAALDAIRRDLPRPTVHARNLFHMSAAMWDAWATYDPTAQGFFTSDKLHAPDVEAARSEAISYAAYRILSERYANAIGKEETLPELDATMAAQCYDTAVTTTDGDTPAALGNRIAAAAIAYGLADGSNEQNNYAAPASYDPVNKPLIVTEPGTKMVDPNRWQPLALDKQEAQNGVFIPGKVQKNVTPFWGHVTSFGLPASTTGLPIDPGPPPKIEDAPDPKTGMNDFQAAAIAVIERSNALNAADTATIDISPASVGNNDLGTNDGGGFSINPVTGEAYAPDTVLLGDFARALTEFWADGPKSETPPGHWNTIANTVGDATGFVPRIGGTGPEVDRLEWDVKTYFALNGALHDAAVAAWGAKGFDDTARPISMIRYMGGLGQSSDKHLPSYNADGLPLVPGLVELITAKTAAPGKRHAALRKHIGEIAINAWKGNPADPATEDGGVGWILATKWVPYQKPTFVTPAFSGFVSGHSTFSRAAAEVLTSMTGSAFFPGGMAEFVVPKGSLGVEAGPSTDVPLQWATYYDAADQAGISRLYGGIHIPEDDFGGRVTGSQCGKAAWALASQYFDGTAPTS
jgi:hypothetical protein